MIWSVNPTPDTVEVWPVGDLRDHYLSPYCWCNPRNDEGVFIHNSMDGRELFETGERKPS
jgi:hypothetical protein